MGTKNLVRRLLPSKVNSIKPWFSRSLILRCSMAGEPMWAKFMAWVTFMDEPAWWAMATRISNNWALMSGSTSWCRSSTALTLAINSKNPALFDMEDSNSYPQTIA